MYDEIVNFIKSLYPHENPIQLHSPIFIGKEIEYLTECINSTFVSYVGKFVTQFEEMTAKYTGAKYAVAVVNGTSALQIALKISGVEMGDEVITQPLTFVATANAISHVGAKPIFIDVDLNSMGMSPEKLSEFLHQNCQKKDNYCFNKVSGKKIKAIVPMHTFGFPCRIDKITEIAKEFNIHVIEDAAESLGSFYKNQHTGTFGLAGILSYNGNKTITTGGGGMIITNDENLARKAKHITTTAKLPHKYEYIHDEVGYNYRLTNINAAIGVAQMENLSKILENKRETAQMYSKYFKESNFNFLIEPENTKSNYWLNCIKFNNKEERELFLEETLSNGIITRPIWRLMNKLEMYKNCQFGNLDNAKNLEDTIVNIPSGFRK